MINRPKHLASDKSSTEITMLHAIQEFKKENNVEIKNIILLQPTSPLRNSKDIKKAIKTFEVQKFDSLLSAYKQKLCLWKKIEKLIMRKTIILINIKLLEVNFKPRK